MYGLSFISPQEGWVVGGNGTILHTSDAGAHWTDQSSSTTAALYAVQFLTERRGTAVGAVGTVLATEDGGATWVAQETQGSVTLFDVYFSDPLTGWVVGNAGAMFQTTDGGGRWIDRTLPCSRTCTRLTDLLRIRFTDPKTGWIVGERGMCGLDRPFQIVDDRQQFLQELLISEPDLVPLIPLGKPLIVIELGRQPEILVVDRLQLLIPGR